MLWNHTGLDLTVGTVDLAQVVCVLEQIINHTGPSFHICKMRTGSPAPWGCCMD